MSRISCLLCVVLALLCSGCDSSDVKDAIDIADGVPRKTIDTSLLGVNAFFNDSRFGSTTEQYREIRDTLKIRRVRVLFSWNDSVQPSSGSAPNFGLYDQIANSVPAGVELLVILTDVPAWVGNPANQVEGNPRATFVERWVRPVARRYASNPAIVGFEIWNEPNMPSNRSNQLLDLTNSPVNYVELLARADSVVRDVAPGKLVVGAATTAINQNFPDTLNYNKAMRDAGARDFTDVWAIHVYGRQFENYVGDRGVSDFLNGLGERIWVTESGAQGVNNQLAYGEQVWPFLTDNIPAIERIYIYQFVEATPSDVTYGLRNLTPGSTLSDLYIFLRDR